MCACVRACVCVRTLEHVCACVCSSDTKEVPSHADTRRTGLLHDLIKISVQIELESERRQSLQRPKASRSVKSVLSQDCQVKLPVHPARSKPVLRNIMSSCQHIPQEASQFLGTSCQAASTSRKKQASS